MISCLVPDTAAGIDRFTRSMIPGGISSATDSGSPACAVAAHSELTKLRGLR